MKGNQGMSSILGIIVVVVLMIYVCYNSDNGSPKTQDKDIDLFL